MTRTRNRRKATPHSQNVFLAYSQDCTKASHKKTIVSKLRIFVSSLPLFLRNLLLGNRRIYAGHSLTCCNFILKDVYDCRSCEEFDSTGLNSVSVLSETIHVCAYVRGSISASREQQLESPDFDLIWLKLRITSHLAFICALYKSPNDNSCAEMFEHLSSQVDHINQRYPSAKVIILGDINSKQTASSNAIFQLKL